MLEKEEVKQPSKTEPNSIICIDESGFEHWVNSVYGWAKRGQKLCGEVTGKRETRQNLNR
ncbi:MAG: hypothetical protein ACK5QS_05660 [Pseudanabaenaceae cyanobacterium]|jgi:putative transposase